MRLLIATACIVAAIACFKPKVQDGGYQCNPSDHTCPPGYSCRLCDLHCWINPNVPCGPIDASVADVPIIPPADAMVDARTIDGRVFDSSVKDGPATVTCGDTVCDTTAGENCMTCQTDCGPCMCFDAGAGCNVCNGDNCKNCPTACGTCSTSCPPTNSQACTTLLQCQQCPLSCTIGTCPPLLVCQDL